MKTQRSRVSVVVGVIIASTLLSVLCPQPARAQAQVIKQTFNEPFDEVFHAADPAVGGCLIEDVHVFGTLPTQTQITIDAKGGLHLKFQQIANLSAVGLSTGDTYRTQGPLVFVEYDFADTSPRDVFFHNVLQLIGPGRDGNLDVHVLFHAVFSATGVQTVNVSKEEVQCH